MELNYLESGNLAVGILTFIVGLSLSFILRSRGISGCLTYILSLVVLFIVISALITGYSVLIESVTFHLHQYIYYNSVGVIGFLIGLIFGIVLKRKR